MKTKQEKIFLLIVAFLMGMLILCLTGCGGSCLGCSFSCESEDDAYVLGGMSWASDGCCASNSCQTATGCMELEESDDKQDSEDNGVENMAMSSCTRSYGGCCGTSSCYNGCFVGKGADCGDCGITCGTENDGEYNENTIGCVDGCFGCEESEGQVSWLYELVYYILGI